ncbi:MAG: S8 family peptidase [Clostridiales bacterium]|nr:S8 family peptidase [Clostridiales bacterium]
MENPITSEDYADFLIQYQGITTKLEEAFPGLPYERINLRYALVHIPLSQLSSYDLTRFGYRAIPKCYTLIDTEALENTGVSRVRRLPYLSLYGNGTYLIVIDTGIDYTLPIFQNEDGTSRIAWLWDQTVDTGSSPEGFPFGSQFSRETITENLHTKGAPLLSRDTQGHGTFLAGIAAGKEDPQYGFSGVAPNADLIVIKLKPAKTFLRNYFLLPEDAIVFQESDIMMALTWALTKVVELGPYSVCFGLGTAQGSHQGDNPLSEYFEAVNSAYGACICTGSGNEGNTQHHASGQIARSGDQTTVELKVGTEVPGFSLEIWGTMPYSFTLGLVSPLGEIIPELPYRLGLSQEIPFLFDRTIVHVDYLLSDSLTGNQLILVRFQNPTPGIWKLNLRGFGGMDMPFHMWLPMNSLITPETYFLTPDPYTTLTSPGNTPQLITCVSHDYRNMVNALTNSRGFTAANQIQPTLSFPGENVLGPAPGGLYIRKSGSSIAAACAAGTAALFQEWGVIRENYPQMNGITIRNLFIKGASRLDSQLYPNRENGYGYMNFYGVFESLLSQ